MTSFSFHAQCYDRLGIFMPTLATGLKILTSRACEITTIRELDEDLGEKDKTSTETARRFLMNLTKIKEIDALPKTLCSEAEEIAGNGATADGGVPGYVSLAYIFCESKTTGERTSKIACSKSMVSKHTVPVNEALGRNLQMDGHYQSY